MESIFLVKNKDKLNQVYKKIVDDKIIDKLCFTQAYSKEDIEENKCAFSNVKYIFSTWYMPTFSMNEVKEYFPSLKAIFYAAGSVKYFAEPFLKNGIRVFSAVKTNGLPVAEYSVAQIILANKGYFQALRTYRKPIYKYSFKKSHMYICKKTGNYNSKVGIIGAGSVGRKVVDLLKFYDLEVYISDPYLPSTQIEKMGAKKVDLLELFKNCDVISNHLPDITETKGILNYELFHLMKPSATFINTGRGAQIVERDLVKALKEQPCRCALLDVTLHEPLFPWSRLIRMKNVFVTPHIAGSISQEEQRLADDIVIAYFDFINKRQTDREVKLEDLYKMT